MIVTTSSSSPALIEQAHRIAGAYGMDYRVRGEKSVAYLAETTGDPQIFVVNHLHGLSYYEPGRPEAFWHPNMAYHRIGSLQNGGTDTLGDVCGLREGMTFFDGTLGLASDALTASYITGGSGRVTGVEKSLPLCILLKEGFVFYGEKYPALRPVLERLRPNIVCGDSLTVLRQTPARAYDVVYFDFMFREPVGRSLGIGIIRDYAVYDTFTDEHRSEATRVAGKTVVVKTDAQGMVELAERGFVCRKKNPRKNFYYMVFETE